MFSEHLQNWFRMHYRAVFFVAGAVVIAIQLTAVATLAADQVKKAELRDSEINQQRTALAQCFENSAGPARRNCLPQASLPNRSVLAGSVLASNLTAGNPQVSNPSNEKSSGAAHPGLMEVSLGSR